MSFQEKEIDKRLKKGKIASLVGIVLNLILAGAKIAVGSMFGVISVLADGLNNLTDCGSSVVSMVSFKLSSRPADKEHPFGHERIEYVFSLIVAFLILLVAFDTVKDGVSKIINPSSFSFSVWVIVALALSILIKVLLYFYYSLVSKKINSSILKASAVDCLTDCISTSVVMLTIILTRLTGFNLDGYAGVLVALFIAWSGIGVLREMFSKLIGGAPDESVLKEIKQKILSYNGVLDVHDLWVHSYGPNKFFASVHIEVDARVDVLVSHELIDDIEKDFFESTNIVLTGHLDPIVTDNEEVNALKEKTIKIVKELNPSFSLHDFRLVVGERRTNVLFDVAIPYGEKLTKAEIVTTLEREIKNIDKKYCAVITVEYNI